jgi:SAM-dependent methyltransferase
MMSAKLDSPSAQRNKEVIWNILKTRVFCPEGGSHASQLRVLEIAAGSGVHSRYFCEQLLLLREDRRSSNSNHTFSESVTWFPTDPTAESRRSIEAYRDDEVSGILQLPLALTLDETGIIQDDLPIDDGSIDVIVCINMIHISPWEATVGLLKAAQRLLKPGSGILYCYGPFREGGTAVESNLYVFTCRMCFYDY